LLERAQLFVKLRFGEAVSRSAGDKAGQQGGNTPKTTLRELFNQTKFKTVRNTMLSDGILPSKGRLIQICKHDYKLEHARLSLSGIPVLKDRVIMAIYIAEMVSSC